MKLLATIAAVACLALVGSAASADKNTLAPSATPGVPLLSQNTIGKLREEIRLQEGRAKELEPIIARDRQARHDVEVNWVVLERHARELHARARDFHQFAGLETGRAQQEINGFGNELETFAVHDDENARIQHELGERLDRLVKGESEARDWHLQHAGRLRDWLAANGG
jgi:hypothetical protein